MPEDQSQLKEALFLDLNIYMLKHDSGPHMSKLLQGQKGQKSPKGPIDHTCQTTYVSSQLTDFSFKDMSFRKLPVTCPPDFQSHDLQLTPGAFPAPSQGKKRSKQPQRLNRSHRSNHSQLTDFSFQHPASKMWPSANSWLLDLLTSSIMPFN